MQKYFKTIPDWLLLCILVLVAVGLRLPLLNGSFWLDEAAQASESVRPLSAQLDIKHDFQPPLLHFIVHFASQVSTSEWWLRLFGAFIPGIGSIIGTYLIGRKLFSQQVGFWSALLLSTSFLHVFYSQELRPYSLPTFWATLSWLLLINHLDQKQLSGKFLVSFGVMSALGLYSSYLYPFLFLSQLVVLMWFYRHHWQRLMWSIILASVLFAPWLPSFLTQLRVGTLLRTQLPGWDQVVSIPQLKVLPLTAATFIYGELNFDLNLLLIGSAIITFGLMTLIGLYFYRFTLIDRRVIILLLWLTVPILTAWIISFLVPVLQPKRVLFSLPAFYLLVSAAVLLVKEKLAKLPTLDRTQVIITGFIGWLLIINGFALFQYWTNPNLQRENWRGLISQITTDYSSGAAVLFGFNAPFAPWVWYAPTNFPVFTPNTLLITAKTDLSSTLKPLNDYHYVILFDYLRDLTDPNRRLEFHLEAHDFKPVLLIDQPKIGFVRIYARPEAVLSYNKQGN